MGKRTMWLAIGLAMVLGLVSLPELQAGRLNDTEKLTIGAGNDKFGNMRGGGMTGTGSTRGNNSLEAVISLPAVRDPALERLEGNLESLRGFEQVGFQAVVDGRTVTGHIRVSDDDQVRVYTTNEGHIYTDTISNFAHELSQNVNIGDSIRLGRVEDGNYITSNLNRSTGNLDSPTLTPVAEVFSTHNLAQHLALTNTTNPSIQESNSDIDFAREAGLISNVNYGRPGIASGTMVISADTAAGDTIRARQTLSGSSVTLNSLEVSSSTGTPRASVAWEESSNIPLAIALERGVNFVGVTYQAGGQNHYAVLERVEDPTGHSDYNIREIDHRPVQMTPQDQQSLIANFGGDSPTATATGIGWLEPGEAVGDQIRSVNSWRDNNGNWHTISGDAGRLGDPVEIFAASGDSAALETGIAAISSLTGDKRNARDLGFSDGFIQAHQNIGIIDQSENIDTERFQRYFGQQLEPSETLGVISTFSLQDQQVFRGQGVNELDRRNRE